MKDRVQFPHSLQWRVNSRGLGTNLLNYVLINECISSILLSAWKRNYNINVLNAVAGVFASAGITKAWSEKYENKNKQ